MIEGQRLSELNDAPERAGDYVLYWMQQSQRAVFNPALEAAIAAANRLRLPVLVAFALADPLPRAKARHYAFMLEGLAETARQLRERDIGFVIRRGSPPQVDPAPGAARCADSLRSRLPARASSNGAARSRRRPRGACSWSRATWWYRPRWHPARPRSARARCVRRSAACAMRFLCPCASVRPRVTAQRLRSRVTCRSMTSPGYSGRSRSTRQSAPVASFHGGHGEARARLRDFVAHGLGSYRAGARTAGRAAGLDAVPVPALRPDLSGRGRARGPRCRRRRARVAQAFWRNSSCGANWR